MRLLDPALFLAWAPLVLAPIVLYLFRPRPRTVRTTTLPFFKWLAREHQDSTWLRWLKHLLSLLLSILVILGGAAALGRLVMAPPVDSLRTVVLLVDRSASMGAQNSDGRTRLEDAVALASRRLAGLPASTGVIVIAYDQRPEVLLSRSLQRREIERALAAIQVRPIRADAEAAVRLAQRLASLETPARVWHLTDAPPRNAASEAEEVAVEHLCVALPEPINVGITALEVRRVPLERASLEAFAQVHYAGPKPVQTEMEIRQDGSLVALRKLSLQPGGRETLLIPVEAATQAERLLTLKVSVPGDVLASDDVVHARIPRAEPIRVLWISASPDPFTELALSSLGAEGDLEILQGKPAAWPPKTPADVTVFDGWLPAQWPDKGAVIVVDPPGPLGPIQAVRLKGEGLPLDSVRAIESAHPLLYGVATDRIAVRQTSVVAAEGPLESLWVGVQGPVLLAGEVRGQRVALLAFSPAKSEHLPFLASYPLLMGNAIYWAAAPRMDTTRGMNRRTGDLVALRGRHLNWSDPGKREGPTAELELTGRYAELDRVGLWETEEGELGSAATLSADETLLPAAPDDAAESAEAEVRGSAFQGDLVPELLWGVLVLLILESGLYHRYWSY